MKKLALAAALVVMSSASSAWAVTVNNGDSVVVNPGETYDFVTYGPVGGAPGTSSYELIFNKDLSSTFTLIDTAKEEGKVSYTLSNGSSVLWTHELTDLLGSATLSFTEMIVAGTYNLMIKNWSATTSSSQSELNAVPLPGAAWLFGSGLLGFMMLSNRRKV